MVGVSNGCCLWMYFCNSFCRLNTVFFAVAEMPPPVPQIMAFEGGDYDMALILEEHTSMTSKVLGKVFLLQCPNDIYDSGKDSASYRTWYRREYARHVHFLARQGQPRAQRVVVRNRDAKNQSQARCRATRRELVRMTRAYDDQLLYGRLHDDHEAAQNVD